MQLAEESTEYKLEQKEGKKSYNNLIKNILEDKKEVTQFINQFIKLRKEIKEEELVRYTNPYLTKKYKARKADLVYKLKEQEIFFLIEHQNKIDDNISYRMLNYCLDLMQAAGKNKKIGKNASYPIIVPIVIYTGRQKWKLPEQFREEQFGDYVLERYKMNMEYNFIDINKFSKQSLLEKDTMFAYAMLLEKSESKEELIGNLENIIDSVKNKNNLEALYKVISCFLKEVLEEEVKVKLLEKIDKKRKILSINI